MTQEQKPPSPAQRKLAYGGYYNRPQQNDDTLLTHVGPGTPCGEYLRRYWHPFLLSSEVSELPVAVRLLGEDLVLFRTSAGAVGLIGAFCPHRLAPLYFGRVEADGLRCAYHA